MADPYNLSPGERRTFLNTDPPYTVNLPSLQTGYQRDPQGIRNGGQTNMIATVNGPIWNPFSQSVDASRVISLLPLQEAFFVVAPDLNAYINYIGPRGDLARAILFGTPASFAPGSSPTDITTWDKSDYTYPFEGLVDEAAGTITAPIVGLYKLDVLVTGQQGNTNKELDIVLWRIKTNPSDPDEVLCVFPVATDKTPWRSWSASTYAELNTNQTLNLALSWYGSSVGTITFGDCSFALTLVDSR